MPPDSSSFTALNIPNDAVPEWMGSFALAAPPNTDLWRKPPSRDTSTAPILYTALRSPFIAAEVTVSADWELEWDQGGLVIFAGAPPGRIAAATTTTTTTAPSAPAIAPSSPRAATDRSSDRSSAAPTPTSPSAATDRSSAAPTPSPPPPSAGHPHPHPHPPPSYVTQTPPPQTALPPPAYTPPAPSSKWVKVGLEFCNNACHATSVCATSDGADWALTSLPAHHARRLDLRVKIERIGYALWVWYEDEASGWKKLREVTWFFWGVEDKAVRVGVYASRPANFGVSAYERRHGGPSAGQRNLCVDFEGLEIF